MILHTKIALLLILKSYCGNVSSIAKLKFQIVLDDFVRKSSTFVGTKILLWKLELINI